MAINSTITVELTQTDSTSSYGRECGGYGRETVFIVGTPDEKGRVGSHPPRVPQSSSSNVHESSSQQAEKLDFVAVQPLQPAWNNDIVLNFGESQRLVRIVSKHADLESALLPISPSSRSNGSFLSLAENSKLFEVTPAFEREIFSLQCVCLVHWPDNEISDASGSVDSLCLFLYEQNSSSLYESPASWEKSSALTDPIRAMGPAAFQSFPAHHFFARVYRPNAIWIALLNHQPTFLCNPEWTVLPWEHQPRTSLDDLLDIVVLLPSLFYQAAGLTEEEPSAQRQSRVVDLLSSCVTIESQFEIWQQMLTASCQSAPFWPDSTAPAQAPFGQPLYFAGPLLCLVHVYYWAVRIQFHRFVFGLIESLGSGNNGAPGIDVRKYQPTQTRALATMMCRSLDSALTMMEGELLVAPVWIVNDFFKSNSNSGGFGPELQWVADFQRKLQERNEAASTWLQEKRWFHVERFG
ncbi:hypothetical protein F5Y18DRAFT_441217 [Xylariaceae sp. FL1019]|nr:hypothetical protein F5Y18DRAFT_441217 [Xylariaceae sp. FL1019]